MHLSSAVVGCPARCPREKDSRDGGAEDKSDLPSGRAEGMSNEALGGGDGGLFRMLDPMV